jgi:hypothetical protein
MSVCAPAEPCDKGSGCTISDCSANHSEERPLALFLPRTSSVVKMICEQCGTHFLEEKEAALCCFGSFCRAVSAPLDECTVEYFVDSRAAWRVASPEEVVQLTRGSLGAGMLSGQSDLCSAVEEGLLRVLRSVSSEALRSLAVKGYSSRPWTISASSLHRVGTLVDCFEAKARIVGPLVGPSKGAIGAALHSLVDAACRNGWFHAHWERPEMKESVLDIAGIGVPVSGVCDALCMGVPVELKTIADMSQSAALLTQWLNQLAVYQMLYCCYSHPSNEARAVLAVVSRDTNQVKAFEVSHGNIARAIPAMKRMLESDPMVTDCLRLAVGYGAARSARRSLALDAGSLPNKPFVDLRPRARGVIADHARRHATLFSDAARRWDLDSARFHCVWFRRCLRSLTAQEADEEAVSSLDRDLHRLAEEVVRADILRPRQTAENQICSRSEAAHARLLHRFSVEVLGTTSQQELTAAAYLRMTDLIGNKQTMKKRKSAKSAKYNRMKKTTKGTAT